MKPMNKLATLLMATAVILGLGACGKKKNGTASTPASTCTMSWDGTLRDQYGRSCNQYQNVGQCAFARYDYNSGRYIDSRTGQVVNCGGGQFFDGYNSIPYQGSYGGQQINGCAGWSQVFGATYIPVDLGYGQLVCLNTAYLGQVTGYGQQYWNQYYQYYQRPIYTCQGYDCYGGGYGGGYSSCSNSFNFGFNYYGVGASFGMCY